MGGLGEGNSQSCSVLCSRPGRKRCITLGLLDRETVGSESRVALPNWATSLELPTGPDSLRADPPPCYPLPDQQQRSPPVIPVGGTVCAQDSPPHLSTATSIWQILLGELFFFGGPPVVPECPPFFLQVTSPTSRIDAYENNARPRQTAATRAGPARPTRVRMKENRRTACHIN